MDEFKRSQHRYCGNGGIHCKCCNYHNGKKRAALNRMARARMKANIIKGIEENMETEKQDEFQKM